MTGFTADEEARLSPYFTNLDQPVFALRNLPEVVKGALFSRYSRTEKSLRRVLLEEFLPLLQEHAGIERPRSGAGEGDEARRRAEEFYERVLVGYGDDSVAELAGAHVAIEGVSTLAAKALEDSRIGLSPLEKSTRYVRFDRPGADGRFLYHRGPELPASLYEGVADGLFRTYSELLDPVLERVRAEFPTEPEDTERAWKAATRAKALDLLRGLLPAGALTNLGLYGNGRAFEYLITKMSASELPEVCRLAEAVHRELSAVIPSFVRRALDERYGAPAAARMVESRTRLGGLAPHRRGEATPPGARLVAYEVDAERRVVVAALFPHTQASLEDLLGGEVEVEAVLEGLLADRANRRQRPARALEHATYTFELVGNFAAYRDLHRHRMLTQDRQLLGVDLGFDLPPLLVEWGFADRFQAALTEAGNAHRRLEAEVGPALAQYLVPLGYRIRWYFQVNLRELYHLCELRTTPQGHPDYRWLAQEMFRQVESVHPRLARYARFVDLSAGDDLERRASERRLDRKGGVILPS